MLWNILKHVQWDLWGLQKVNPCGTYTVEELATPVFLLIRERQECQKARNTWRTLIVKDWTIKLKGVLTDYFNQKQEYIAIWGVSFSFTLCSLLSWELLLTRRLLYWWTGALGWYSDTHAVLSNSVSGWSFVEIIIAFVSPVTIGIANSLVTNTIVIVIVILFCLMNHSISQLLIYSLHWLLTY